MKSSLLLLLSLSTTFLKVDGCNQKNVRGLVENRDIGYCKRDTPEGKEIINLCFKCSEGQKARSAYWYRQCCIGNPPAISKKCLFYQGKVLRADTDSVSKCSAIFLKHSATSIMIIVHILSAVFAEVFLKGST